MKGREQAHLLLPMAEQDLYLLQTHAQDPKLKDELWGFHAQQATEKLLKALLTDQGVQFPFTHRLRLLADLIRESRIDLPDRFEPLFDLTPYAAELRYAPLSLLPDASALDRNVLLALVADLYHHATLAVGYSPGLHLP